MGGHDPSRSMLIAVRLREVHLHSTSSEYAMWPGCAFAHCAKTGSTGVFCAGAISPIASGRPYLPISPHRVWRYGFCPFGQISCSFFGFVVNVTYCLASYWWFQYDGFAEEITLMDFVWKCLAILLLAPPPFPLSYCHFQNSLFWFFL